MRSQTVSCLSEYLYHYSHMRIGRFPLSLHSWNERWKWPRLTNTTFCGELRWTITVTTKSALVVCTQIFKKWNEFLWCIFQWKPLSSKRTADWAGWRIQISKDRGHRPVFNKVPTGSETGLILARIFVSNKGSPETNNHNNHSDIHQTNSSVILDDDLPLLL